MTPSKESGSDVQQSGRYLKHQTTHALQAAVIPMSTSRVCNEGKDPSVQQVKTGPA